MQHICRISCAANARLALHTERFNLLSRQIWESPELAFHEECSSDLLQQELKVNGFTVRRNVAGMPTAFVAEWGSGKPIIGLMAEFDALPTLSQKDAPVQSPVREGDRCGCADREG